MPEPLRFVIDGQWVTPSAARLLEVINPASEDLAGHIPIASAEDVNAAVMAARRAFPAWSRTSRADRVAALKRIVTEYKKRLPDAAAAITAEMGAPAAMSKALQATAGLAHLYAAIKALERFEFEHFIGSTRVVREPIGVCALITPWNWPINQIACKVAPAIAMGCTMVLKPSEVSPLSAQVWAEAMAAADLPPGVFNMIHGDGPTTGNALTAHRHVDMVSFTGSTRAGIEIARNAAATVKRVAQELGGKSANIILDDEGFAAAVENDVKRVMQNSGQSCNAPTRMLLPSVRIDEGIEIARRTAEAICVGDPATSPDLGPVASRAQWNRVQEYIQKGIEEGATLVAGGPGLPDGINRGCYARPTVFARVKPGMTIERDEIFGPVLSILEYSSVDEAVDIANDSPYGLAAYVSGRDNDVVQEIASRLRVGQVNLNGVGLDLASPFGGYKQSGNGREWGEYGFHEFTELKSIVGGPAAPKAA